VSVVLQRGVSVYSLKLLNNCRPYMVECKPLNEVCREGKKIFERPSRKWEDNNMKVLREICYEDVYKIRLFQIWTSGLLW